MNAWKRIGNTTNSYYIHRKGKEHTVVESATDKGVYVLMTRRTGYTGTFTNKLTSNNIRSAVKEASATIKYGIFK